MNPQQSDGLVSDGAVAAEEVVGCAVVWLGERSWQLGHRIFTIE
jgi:hypothetical protein